MENGPGQGRNSSSQPPLRDWQKDTWYGPYPMNENPFDEPEDAPELRELRSEELNNRSGEFWETHTTGYQYRPEERGNAARPRAEKPAVRPVRRTPEEEGTRRKRKLAAVLLTVVGFLVLGLVAYYGVLSVDTIRVIGNSRIPEGEVIRLSGLRRGQPILAIQDDVIRERVEQNPVLVLKYLEKQLPRTVILSVREREACCWMTWNGILYTMDKQRIVLYETEDLTVRPAELVRVDGLRVRSGALVGQQLVLENVEQQMIFSSLFLEMKVLGCTGMIEEADLSNEYSLLLTTRDGFTVSLGDSTNLHAKMRSMLLTREELIRRGYQGGVINVTLPENPVYSPSETN